MQTDVVHPEDVEHPPPPRKDRVAAWIADRCATVEFAGLNVAVAVLWPLLGVESFPYPGLTWVLSIEAILLTVCVLVQQRLQLEMQRRETEADLKNDALAADASARTEEMLKKVLAKLEAA